MSTATPERTAHGVPMYCPHKGCTWSFVGSRKAGEGYLETHLRVLHKGVDPRTKVASPVVRQVTVEGPEPAAAAPPPPQTQGRHADGTTWSRKALSREEAIGRMTEALTELGYVPFVNQWRSLRRSPSEAALNRIFGAYDDAVRACGFEPAAKPVVQSFTPEEIIDAIQKHAVEHGQPPTARDWKLRADGRPTEDQVARAFGNWGSGIEAAGFPRPAQAPRPTATVAPRAGRPRVSGNEVVAALQAAAAELGVSPTSKWWKRNNRTPATATIYRLFGSWPAALEASGLPVPAPTNVRRTPTLAEPDQGRGESRSEATPVTASESSGSANAGDELLPALPPASSDVAKQEAPDEVTYLLALIRDLDAADHDAPEHIDITRWVNGTGVTDDTATALIRRLLVQRLRTHGATAVGEAVLEAIS